MPETLKKFPYLDKFGLKEAPYTTNPNERFLFLTTTHQEAIANIDHVLEYKEGACVVIGSPGTGKTTLLRYIYSFLTSDPKYIVAAIENANRFKSEYQMLKETLEAFGEECKGQDTQARYKQFEEFIFACAKKNIVPILLIDEAQHMERTMLESLRGLLNLETPELGKLLQIILFAMPEIERRLKSTPKKPSSLGNRLWRNELEPMTRAETEEMLRWRFAQAGGKVFPFEEEALETIHSLSKGNPRTICAIAQFSLEIAALRNTSIDATIIQEVSKKRFLNN